MAGEEVGRVDAYVMIQVVYVCVCVVFPYILDAALRPVRLLVLLGCRSVLTFLSLNLSYRIVSVELQEPGSMRVTCSG